MSRIAVFNREQSLNESGYGFWTVIIIQLLSNGIAFTRRFPMWVKSLSVSDKLNSSANNFVINKQARQTL